MSNLFPVRGTSRYDKRLAPGAEPKHNCYPSAEKLAEEYGQVKRGFFEDVLSKNEIEIFSMYPQMRHKLYFSLSDAARILGKPASTIHRYIKRFELRNADKRSALYKDGKYNPWAALRLDRNQMSQIFEISRMCDTGYTTPQIHDRLRWLRKVKDRSRMFLFAVVTKKYNTHRTAVQYVPAHQVLIENTLKRGTGFEDEQCRELAAEICRNLYHNGYDVAYFGDRLIRSDRVSKGSRLGKRGKLNAEEHNVEEHNTEEYIECPSTM